MTNTQSLGVLGGPVLLFGGPYGNLEATLALRAAARRFGIPASRTVCTGDVVAYGADPQAVVDLIRDWGCAVVMGNCEEALAADAADCGCGFEEGTTCAALSDQWFTATRRDLDADAKRWMGSLPRRVEFEIGGRRLVAVHGAPTQINRFIFQSTPADVKAAEIAAACADGIVAGHCGLPFTEITRGALWHNSGALGLPANDGTPRVWYSLIAATAGGLRIEHKALAYDYAAAAAKMRARFYPPGYADCLSSGLWPSLDVLPAAERTATGRALVEAAYLWPSARSEAAE